MIRKLSCLQPSLVSLPKVATVSSVSEASLCSCGVSRNANAGTLLRMTLAGGKLGGGEHVGFSLCKLKP